MLQPCLCMHIIIILYLVYIHWIGIVTVLGTIRYWYQVILNMTTLQRGDHLAVELVYHVFIQTCDTSQLYRILSCIQDETEAWWWKVENLVKVWLQFINNRYYLDQMKLCSVWDVVLTRERFGDYTTHVYTSHTTLGAMRLIHTTYKLDSNPLSLLLHVYYISTIIILGNWAPTNNSSS